MDSKSYLYGGIAGILLLVVIFFVGKNYGKYAPPSAIKDPGDIKTDPSFNPTALTDRLFKDIDGISNIFNRDMVAWNQFAALSDSDFVQVCNDWDKRYYGKYQQTLFEAFKGETFWYDSYNLYYALLNRFNKIEKFRKP